MRNRKKSSARVKRFLSSLSTGATVSFAAEQARVSPSTVYKWRTSDPAFAVEWDAAVEAGTDRLEDEAYRRALEGVERPVYFGGKPIGSVRDYSDSLLVLMLKARRPGKFKDKVTEKDPVSEGLEQAHEALISKLIQKTSKADH
ncbi:hypothetical protein QGN29_10850 [Temperatibacter marinus]|uniref:Terminase n=1 Tax=Temperatibacter marinus TaxID=1456591 RepID=A0AA52H9U2_9PROT|nr:hypothetical protein [Temperatibacter marinus]WND02045.1 hypothetical protein QGN29_10850 [Temperatibacter marinus]